MSLCQYRVNWCRQWRGAAPNRRLRAQSQALCLHDKESRGLCNVRPNLQGIRSQWKQHRPSIRSRTSSIPEYLMLRSVHTKDDVRKKIINLVEEFEAKDAQHNSIQTTPSEQTATIEAPASRKKNSVLDDRKMLDGNVDSMNLFSDQPGQGLDGIFVNPVLHLDSRQNAGLPSRSTRSRFYHKWFEAFSRVSIYRLGVQVPGATITSDMTTGFAGLLPKNQESPRVPTQSKEPAILAVWQNLRPEQRSELWMSALLYALCEDSRIAAKLLLTIMDHDKDLLPPYVVGDAIALICHTLLPGLQSSTTDEQGSADMADIELCLDVVIRFFECYEGVHYLGSLSRLTIGLITKPLNGAQIEKWVEKLIKNSHYLAPGDRLYLATHATARGKPAVALDLLRTLSSELMDNTYVTAACDQMLRTELPTENLTDLRSNMLMLMLELGVRPDARMRDQIISLAMDADDRQSAWDIHEQALKNDIAPSARTYIHLLDGVRQADDLSTLFAIYREARQAELTQFSPQLGNALIRALFHALEGSKRAFDTMLVMYAELFDLKPLKALGFAEHMMPQKDVRRMRPPVLTLQAMTIAWIKSCRSLQKLKAVYQTWFDDTGPDSSRIALTKRRPHVARAFIVQFEHLGSKEMCDQVMKDLLHSQSSSGSIVEVKGVANMRAPVELDVKIWTSLIQTYTRRGQLDEAEHLVRLMKSHGIQPDGVTFEVLLLAYARNQDIPKAVETMGEKHQAGYDLDEWTLRAVGEIRDRETLRKSLQEMSFEHS